MRLHADTVFDPVHPTVEMTELDESELSALRADLARVHPDAVVRVLRGDRMRTLPGLTQEMTAALQLPAHISANWSSLTDGLRDLHFGDATSYLLIVRAAADVLADDEPDGLITLLDVIGDEDHALQEVSDGRNRMRMLLAQPPYALWQLERRLSDSPIEVGRTGP